MAASAEELKELVMLARESGDTDLEEKALNQYIKLTESAPVANAEDFAGLEGFAPAEEPQSSNTEPVGVADIAQGVLETGRSIVEGAVLGTPAYMAGAIEGVIRRFTEKGFSPEDAADLANESAAFFMTPPESQTGQAIAGKAEEVLGGLPPIMGGVAGQIPNIAAGVQGVKSVTSHIPEQTSNAIPQTRGKQDIARQLESGQTNAPTVGYQLKDPQARELSRNTRVEQIIEGVPEEGIVEFTGDTEFPLLDAPADVNISTPQSRVGKVVSFPEAKKLQKQGFEDKSIAAWQQYTKDESVLAERMAKIKRASIGNENVVRQPLSIVGNAVNDQVKILSDAKNKAGKRIARSLNQMRGKRLNYGQTLESWRGQLEEMGIKINQDTIADSDTGGGIQWNTDLRGSKFAKDPGTQKMLDLVVDRLSVIANKEGSFDNATAKDLHDLKKLIDYRVSWSRMPGDDGLTPEAESLVKSLRGGINDVLKKGSSEYEAANADYAAAITPLAKLNESTGRRVNILDDNLKPETVGLEMRKTIGNWANTPDLREAVKGLSLESKRRGYDKNINLDRLVILNGTLDKRFGVSSSKQGTMQGVMDAALNAQPVNAALEMGKASLKKARKIDDKKAMEDLIKLFNVNTK